MCARIITSAFIVGFAAVSALASSHREAPLISNDPQADNTDLYAFRSPDDTNTVTIIANYIPFENPDGGPNYYTFGENIRYEIHIDNDASKVGDEITYRFTFTHVNEDTTTFFNIRLGKQNLKTSYTCQKSTDNGATWTTIVQNGAVPPPNIGPRSIEGGAGLNTTYATLMQNAIITATGGGGETVFCGPVDDPFFVDLGGIFDLGQTRTKGDTGSSAARDGLAGFNCHTIALKIPIATLQKNHQSVSAAANILDGNYVIGVWASASRPQIVTIPSMAPQSQNTPWVQVSRLGMPLTNEAIIPIGQKDRWNATTPYDASEASFIQYFTNPELALYMGNGTYSGAVPALANLKIQTNSLGSFNFTDGSDGLYGLYGNVATHGTALDTAIFGKILLQSKAPRSADILPIFYTGVPNLAPYQLATGKTSGPLSAGKPFMNNFLPSLGDELRLNMAVPVTPRSSADFSSEGIIQAAVLGLTDARFNTSTAIQNIPNMDGFPNGRRLEDDVTRIELQAVGGAALAAIGLWYDDYTSGSPVTPDLLGVLGYTTGVEHNDVAFQTGFPFEAAPHNGYSDGIGEIINSVKGGPGNGGTDALGFSAPSGFFIGQNYPNPTAASTTLGFHTASEAQVSVKIYDIQGKLVTTAYDGPAYAGDHNVQWKPASNMPNGVYIAQLTIGGQPVQSMKISVAK
ncbi:MAG TPA: DUF4331 family protein [Candidatus Kapabacteria bacterium]|nr:DUF4331 family protein [Candidatus Kapabacteria bacterium]